MDVMLIVSISPARPCNVLKSPDLRQSVEQGSSPGGVINCIVSVTYLSCSEREKMTEEKGSFRVYCVCSLMHQLS